MTIEFNCPHCDKPLKTSDDKAGRDVKCPGCGERIQIPNADEEILSPSTGDAYPDSPSGDENGDVTNQDPAGRTRLCPACGATIKARAARCRFCGEILSQDRLDHGRTSLRREMRPFPPGEVLSDAWTIFAESLGLQLGTYFTMGLLNLLASVLWVLPALVAMFLIDQKNEGAALVVGGLALILLFVWLGFSYWLLSGYLILQLKLVRGEDARFADLFSGGPFTGRLLLTTLAFSFLVSLGISLCFVPGVIFTVMLFPFAFVIVDEDVPGFSSLGRAMELTKGNWGSIFLLFCFCALLSMVAGLTIFFCGPLGQFLLGPYLTTLLAVAYDRMKCQTPLGEIGV